MTTPKVDKINHEVIYEKIASTGQSCAAEVIVRFRVPGGWIYSTSLALGDPNNNPAAAMSSCFVPDLAAAIKDCRCGDHPCTENP